VLSLGLVLAAAPAQMTVTAGHAAQTLVIGVDHVDQANQSRRAVNRVFEYSDFSVARCPSTPGNDHLPDRAVLVPRRRAGEERGAGAPEVYRSDITDGHDIGSRVGLPEDRLRPGQLPDHGGQHARRRVISTNNRRARRCAPWRGSASPGHSAR